MDISRFIRNLHSHAPLLPNDDFTQVLLAAFSNITSQLFAEILVQSKSDACRAGFSVQVYTRRADVPPAMRGRQHAESGNCKCMQVYISVVRHLSRLINTVLPCVTFQMEVSPRGGDMRELQAAFLVLLQR